MKKLFFVCLLLNQAFAQLPKADLADWQPLFNGKDLTGWTPKIRGYELGNNFGNTFRIENGNLSVRYDQYDAFDERYGHIFYKDKFSYYVIAVEYRFVGNQVKGGPDWAIRNNGVMLHCQDPKTMGKDQDFPISIEAQLLGGNGKDKRTTCNLCTPGTNVVLNGKLFTPHCINSTSETYNGDQWVRAEFIVLGDSLIQHYANGQKVMEYTKPQMGGGTVSGHDPAVKIDGMMLKDGYISLQSESHPTDFRKIEILNLIGCTDPKAINFRDYYLKSDNSTCVYKKKNE